MDPMSNNIIMKNVAGFHSEDFGSFALSDELGVRRNGLGTSDAQNEG